VFMLFGTGQAAVKPFACNVNNFSMCFGVHFKTYFVVGYAHITHAVKIIYNHHMRHMRIMTLDIHGT